MTTLVDELERLIEARMGEQPTCPGEVVDYDRAADRIAKFVVQHRDTILAALRSLSARQDQGK
jgi:hypothetical protein